MPALSWYLQSARFPCVPGPVRHNCWTTTSLHSVHRVPSAATQGRAGDSAASIEIQRMLFVCRSPGRSFRSRFARRLQHDANQSLIARANGNQGELGRAAHPRPRPLPSRSHLETLQISARLSDSIVVQVCRSSHVASPFDYGHLHEQVSITWRPLLLLLLLLFRPS